MVVSYCVLLLLGLFCVLGVVSVVVVEICCSGWFLFSLVVDSAVDTRNHSLLEAVAL